MVPHLRASFALRWDSTNVRDKITHYRCGGLFPVDAGLAVPGCDGCAIELDHAAAIDRETCEFAAQVEEATRAVATALKAAGALAGELYDIEMAEGPQGRDALLELETAARALRNAQRIADWRRDLMLRDLVRPTSAAGRSANPTPAACWRCAA
jgi:hypothetical protein